MNSKQRQLEMRGIYNSYHPQGGSPRMTCKKNHVRIDGGDTLLHELTKSLTGIMIRKFGDVKITPSIIQRLQEIDEEVTQMGFCKNLTDFISECIPNRERDRRVDIVMLSDDTRFEIETSPRVHKDNCIRIYVGRAKDKGKKNEKRNNLL